MKKRFISSFIEAKFLIARCLTLLILALLSTNLAWGETVSVELCTSWDKTLAYKTEYTQDYTINDLNGSTTTMTLGVKGVYRQSKTDTYFQMNKNTGYLKNTTKLPGKITKIETTWSAAKGPTKCYFASNAEASSSDKTVTVTAATSVTYTPPTDADYYYFNIDVSTGSGSAQMTSCKVYYEKSDKPAAELVSIAISGTPDKTTYEAGEEFDPAGLVVTGTYSEGDPEEITTGITWEVTPNPLTAGTTSVSVTAKVGEVESPAYQVNGLTVTEFVQTYANTYTSDASLSNVIKGSKVKWEGCKEADGYAALKIGKGETASITVPAGTKTVHLHMVAWNGESADVAVKLGSTALSSIKPTADDKVSGSSTTYTINTEPKTENSYYFPIEVNADEETTLSLTTGSSKRAILFGVNFEADTKPLISADVEEIEFEQKELSGTVTDSKTISATGKNLTAAISASMKSGSAAVFSVTPVGTPTAAEGEFTVSYSTTEAGEYAGTVVLSSGETSIEIPVSASVVAHIPVLQSIYVKGEPTKKEYYVGDAFETVGLEVWGKYDVGDDQQITEGIEWEVTPATFSATTETSVSVVAKALEKTSEAFEVTGLTVNEAPKTVTYDFTTKLYGHTGVSSGSDNHDGDIAVNEVFTEAPTQIKFIKSGSTVTRFWSNKGTSELRIYNGAEFTISSTDYNITKVEFSGTVNLKVGETAVSDKTWTGKQKSVTFVNAKDNSALTGITVYYATAAPSAATPTITPSTEAETYWEPITITLASTTEDATIYYTTDGTTPTAESTLYEAAFEVSKTTTIKAIAVKDGLDNSEVATKEFKFGPIFTSLEDLAAADLTSGTTVKVSFENVPIKSIFVAQQGYRNGIYFDIQKGGKDIEIYYQNVPETWVAGGKVSGTMICPWKSYSGTWELAPEKDSWTWSNLTYEAPKATLSITSAKWGTFCAPFDVELEEGVKAYIASEESGTIKFTEVDGTIDAGTPVVVYKDITETYTKDYSAAVEDFNETCQDGALVGVYAAKSGITAETGYTNYVLQNNAQGVGFYKVAEGSTISLKANRCYMTLPTSSAAKDGFSFEEIITGINEILNPTKKSVEGIFDLNGRKLATPQKGINIINGVKVIVK